ncbi:hypothetical protein [Marinomonas epiphytica]
MLFYVRHKSKIPYYQFSEKDCVSLLHRAVEGSLLERDWHVFIGMSIRDNKDLESLRETCIFIDDSYVKRTRLLNGQQYMVFNKNGVLLLETLLDEWRHKVLYEA